MIRHHVLVRFRGDLPADEKQAIFDQLAALRNNLSGILDFRYGPNISPEDHVVHGFRDAFWFDFVDAAARDAYLVDPDHKAAGGRLVGATEGGRQGLVVLDMEV